MYCNHSVAITACSFKMCTHFSRMKIKEINRTAIQSWSPAQHHPIYLATGISMQQAPAAAAVWCSDRTLYHFCQVIQPFIQPLELIWVIAPHSIALSVHWKMTVTEKNDAASFPALYSIHVFCFIYLTSHTAKTFSRITQVQNSCKDTSPGSIFMLKLNC